MKYVWLNLSTGKFSNSWTEEEHNIHWPDPSEPKDIPDDWRLIKFESVDHPDWEFNNLMVIK